MRFALYADGLLMAVPLGAVALSAAVDVKSGNTFVGLPPAPLLLTPSPTAIGLSLSTSVDVNGNSTAYWGFTQQAASEGARCAQPPGASVGGSPAGALTSTLGTPGSIGSLCYVLRLESTATEITPRIHVDEPFNEWGGAYGFVFERSGCFSSGSSKLRPCSASTRRKGRRSRRRTRAGGSRTTSEGRIREGRGSGGSRRDAWAWIAFARHDARNAWCTATRARRWTSTEYSRFHARPPPPK